MVSINESSVVQLLQFLKSEQWANAVVRYCEREGICSRATTFKLLNAFEEEGTIQRRKEGQKVFYRITQEGEKRIQIDADLDVWRFPPSKVRLWQAETKITSLPESLPPAIKSRLRRIMNDANLSRELGTLTGTATLAYAMSFKGRPSLKSFADRTGAGYSGGFTDSGRCDMMIVLGIERSNMVRRMLESGRFDGGITGLVGLIFETGYQAVVNAFDALGDASPQAKSLSVTLLAFSSDNAKIRREAMAGEDIAVRFVRELSKSRPELFAKAIQNLGTDVQGKSKSD